MWHGNFLFFKYTDELAPLMEWLEESITKSTREIQSNSVAETEQILERHEKNLDQLDKKKKVFMDQKSKGEKLLNDPKAPKFLNGHMDRLNGLWKEANNKGEDRLEDLKNNLVAWEAYENKRNQLDDQLNQVGNTTFFFHHNFLGWCLFWLVSQCDYRPRRNTRTLAAFMT